MADSAFPLRPIVTICPACDELGIVRHVGGKCWMCGGWVDGHEYPMTLALRISDVISGRAGSLS